MNSTSDDGRRPQRIVVVGAGAAGLMAAAEAAGRGADVHLLEKNSKTGVKILMSGGTRCNITQDTDARGIANAFGKSGRFLQKSVGAFDPSDVVRMFNREGVATKVESTGKVFPKSDRALHVRDALEKRARTVGAKIHLRRPVTSFEKRESGWRVSTENDSLHCDRLIITSGGKSWPGCGTTGRRLRVAASTRSYHCANPPRARAARRRLHLDPCTLWPHVGGLPSFGVSIRRWSSRNQRPDCSRQIETSHSTPLRMVVHAPWVFRPGSDGRERYHDRGRLDA